MNALTPTRHSAIISLPDDDQILISRTFAAPPSAVYRLFTEPELIARWWAGRQGRVTSIEVDLRVGGRWRYAMDTGSFELAFRGVYRDIVPEQRIVNTEIYESGPGATNAEPGAVCTYSFAADGSGGTAFSLLTQVTDRAARDAILESGMEAGVQDGYDIVDELAVEIGVPDAAEQW